MKPKADSWPCWASATRPATSGVARLVPAFASVWYGPGWASVPEAMYPVRRPESGSPSAAMSGTVRPAAIPFPVAAQDGDAGGEAAAGAVAHDRDAAGVDAKFGRVAGEPGQPGIGILDRNGMRVLWCEPVLQGQHRHAGTGHVP
jgi:hypothetical protein